MGAFGASFDKTIQPPCRAGKTGKPGLWPDGNAPLSPPAAVLPPEGEVCSMLSPCVNLSCSLHNGTKRVHFCCGDPAEGLQVGRSLSLACTQKDLPMNRPTDEARLYGLPAAAAISTGCLSCPAPIVPTQKGALYFKGAYTISAILSFLLSPF